MLERIFEYSVIFLPNIRIFEYFKNAVFLAKFIHKNKEAFKMPEQGDSQIALQNMQTFEKQAKIMLTLLVTLLLIKVSNCAYYMLYMKMRASTLATSGYQPQISYDQLCQKFQLYRAICENFFQKNISMCDISDFRSNFAKTEVKNLQKVPNRGHKNFGS